MEVFELIIDEDHEMNGVQALSLVSDPAIESDWVTLSKQKEIKLKIADEEKRILMGAALIPNKPIYRKSGEDEYNIFFSSKTVRKASELFFKNGYQSSSTLEHELDLKGNTVVESWIVEDKDKDKTSLYKIDAPVGTWMISMKIQDDDVWKMAKEGVIKGFSIEGYFADKMTKQSAQKEEKTDEDLLNEILAVGENTTE